MIAAAVCQFMVNIVNTDLELDSDTADDRHHAQHGDSGHQDPRVTIQIQLQQRGVQHIVQHGTVQHIVLYGTVQQAVQHLLQQAVQHIVRHGPGVPPRRVGGVAGRGGAGSASVLPGAVNTVL